MDKINNTYYKCEFCGSDDVEIDDSCNCIVIDLKCNKCGEESTTLKEGIEQELDSDTLAILKGDIPEETVYEMRDIISSFMEDFDIPLKGTLTNEQRELLFTDLMTLMKESKETIENDKSKVEFPTK